MTTPTTLINPSAGTQRGAGTWSKSSQWPISEGTGKIVHAAMSAEDNQQTASAAQKSGRFKDEIVPVTGKVRKGDTIVADTPYRNPSQQIATYMFATSVPLQAGKTVASVTLPKTVSAGDLHVFAIGSNAGPLTSR